MCAASSSARSTPSTSTWPRLGRMQPARERGHGRLARSRRPGDRHHFSRCGVDVQAVEHEPAVEAHVDVGERDAGRLRPGSGNVRGGGTRHPLAAHLDHLAQAVLRAAEVLPGADEAVEPRAELRGERRELERDEERAERDVVVRHQPRAHVEQQRLGEDGQRLHRQVEPREQSCARHRVPVHAQRHRRDLRRARPLRGRTPSPRGCRAPARRPRWSPRRAR